MPGADTKIIAFVKKAADRFTTLGATVQEVSVPMHFDGMFLLLTEVSVRPYLCKGDYERTATLVSFPYGA